MCVFRKGEDMANSLRAKLSKLRHDGHITDAEYQAFIKKMDGHDREIRNKAIDECYMKAKTMMEELAYQNQGRRNGKTHRLYCVQALEFLRQVAKELKGVQNDNTD